MIEALPVRVAPSMAGEAFNFFHCHSWLYRPEWSNVLWGSRPMFYARPGGAAAACGASPAGGTAITPGGAPSCGTAGGPGGAPAGGAPVGGTGGRISSSPVSK